MHHPKKKRKTKERKSTTRGLASNAELAPDYVRLVASYAFGVCPITNESHEYVLFLFFFLLLFPDRPPRSLVFAEIGRAEAAVCFVA